jgi:hypothetical protein
MLAPLVCWTIATEDIAQPARQIVTPAAVPSISFDHDWPHCLYMA